MTTYYLDGTNGLDSNDGLSVGNAKQTLAGVTGLLDAGDRLEIRTGTYTGGSNAWDPLGAGTDFGSGAITIIPYQSEVVTINGPSGDHAINLEKTQHHIIFDNLRITTAVTGGYGIKIQPDGSNSVSAHHIRFQNCEIHNCNNSGIGTVRSSTADSFKGGFNEFINCIVRNNGGDTFDHGLYISTPNNLIEGCDIHDNAGYGIHNDADDTANNYNIYRNNRIYNHAAAAGMIFSAGTGHLAYNNLIYDNAWGINIDTSLDTGIYNNTLVENGYGIYFYGTGSATFVAKGNLIIASTIGVYIESGSGVHTVTFNMILDSTSNAVLDTPGNSTVNNNITTGNAAFVDEILRDLRITAASSARDSASDLSAVMPSVDLDGNVRPRGLAWDFGAYEFAEPTIRLAYRLS